MKLHKINIVIADTNGHGTGLYQNGGGVGGGDGGVADSSNGGKTAVSAGKSFEDEKSGVSNGGGGGAVKDGEGKRSLISRLFFIWFDKFVLLGQNGSVNPSQFWDLEADFR